ncbi:MAG: hypothetical protein JKY52_02610, partial [Flavobacteriales bacterium]|nr:hypothetical protein [Flavobacteriales bacterium]
YSYEFEKEYFPAVIIEAVDLDRKFKWDKKLSVESMKELERLREDGHDIHAGKRFYSAEYKLDNIRATQLYRTLPHEFGHYVHYLKEVVTPLANMKGTLNQLDAKIGDDDTSESNPLLNEWDKLDNEYNAEINKLEDLYFALPTNEKEVFAHKYAGKLRNQLINEGYIPFNRILSVDKTKSLGLNLNDFKE